MHVGQCVSIKTWVFHFSCTFELLSGLLTLHVSRWSSELFCMKPERHVATRDSVTNRRIVAKTTNFITLLTLHSSHFPTYYTCFSSLRHLYSVRYLNGVARHCIKYNTPCNTCSSCLITFFKHLNTTAPLYYCKSWCKLIGHRECRINSFHGICSPVL